MIVNIVLAYFQRLLPVKRFKMNAIFAIALWTFNDYVAWAGGLKMPIFVHVHGQKCPRRGRWW